MLISKSEQSYICTSLLANPPHRADGRSLLDTRSIVLSTGVAPLANGSARACIGESEVIAAVRLEVEDCRGVDSEGRDGGRIVCSVVW
jgi:exosome complex component RRP42